MQRLAHPGPDRAPAPRNGRFFTLDALRGVAAGVIVFAHFGVRFGGTVPPLAYLAVDFFFVLSGFVLAYSYDDRLRRRQISVGAFMARRIERLAPLFFAGAALGLLSQIVMCDPGLNGRSLFIAIAIAMNGLGLPSLFEGTFGGYMPLNGPFWSLFFELWIANLVYAVTARHGGNVLLALVLLVCAAGLAIHESHFGIGAMAGGWSFQSFGVGFLRVGFSFSAGVALCRIRAAGHMPVLRMPSAVWLILVLAMLCAPVAPGLLGESVEMFFVFVGFPLVVGLGSSGAETFPAAEKWLGSISYAAYTLHWPLIQLLFASAKSQILQHVGAYQSTFLLAAVVIASVAAPLDQRLRGWLRTKRI